MVGDDNAISDTVYFLAKALNSERIDLATFMKVSLGGSHVYTLTF